MQRRSPPPPAGTDRSTNNASPTPRRSPPPSHQQQAPQHHQPPPQQYQQSQYQYAHPHHPGPTYMYAAPPPPPQYAHHPHDDPRNAQHAHASPYGHPYGTYVPYPMLSPPVASSAPPSGGAAPNPGLSMTVGGGPGGGLGAGIAVMHTDDAATKLSDRVRRRCFNCCTTETSTWRRSNLSPGKVLCNKCGLFERTHSRPRPEQFPHKRGPLASSTLRSPGAGGGGGQQQAQVGYQPYPPPNAAPNSNSGVYMPAPPSHDSASAPPGGYAPPPTSYAPPPGAYAPPPHTHTNPPSHAEPTSAPQQSGGGGGGSISHPGTPNSQASGNGNGKDANVGSRPPSRLQEERGAGAEKLKESDAREERKGRGSPE